MKKISFKCRNRDGEILAIVSCILLFLAGWLISSAISRTYGGNVLVTTLLPLGFLVCGVVYMSRRRKAVQSDDSTGTAEFAGSGRIRLTYGGRRVTFDSRDIRSVEYAPDRLSRNTVGECYILTVRLPMRKIRLFSEALPDGATGFESSDLYPVYRELCRRKEQNERSE